MFNASDSSGRKLARRGLCPASPDADDSMGSEFGSNGIDRTVVTLEITTHGLASTAQVECQRDAGVSVATALTRIAVMVALASVAVLVLLPAAIAAQAASTF